MNVMSTTTDYSSLEVCAAAHVTFRQLDYWCRLGLVVPSVRQTTGPGANTRRWSTRDIAVVTVLGRVAGVIPVNRLGRLVEFLSDLPLRSWATTVVVLNEDGEVWLPGSAAPKVGVHVDLSLVWDC